MPYSYNGWRASPDPDDIGIRLYTVPGTDRQIWLNKDAAPILLWAMSQWDKRVEPIDQGVLDDWGWNYRRTRGGTSLSTHASGTSDDINATKYPRGTNRMSAVKQKKVRGIIAEANAISRRVNGGRNILNWGGEWSGEFKDQMHTELANGTDAADVARVMKVLNARDWFDMATEAQLRAIVREEVAKVAGQVWAHKLEDPTSTTTPKAKYTAGGWLRGANKRRNEIIAAFRR